MYNHKTQYRQLSLAHATHSTETQQKKIAESGSSHTAQGLSRRRLLSLAHNSRLYQDPRTPRRTGQSLAYTRTGFYLSESGEPKSHTPEHHFIVTSLAALDHAGWGLCTYRIPASGTDGCFNDLHNSCPVTLYLWTTDSAVSCLLGFLQSQCYQASGTGQELLCLPSVMISVALTRLPSSGRSPPPRGQLLGEERVGQD